MWWVHIFVSFVLFLCVILTLKMKNVNWNSKRFRYSPIINHVFSFDLVATVFSTYLVLFEVSPLEVIA